MNVDFAGRTVNFADIPSGGFFMFKRRDDEIFGVCVSIGTSKGAIVFAGKDRSQGEVRLASGGLTGDAMIYFESAVTRPDQPSISTATDGPDGALINTADSFYMRVNDGFTGYRTFNIQSGANETPPENAKSIHFAKWQAGLIVDNKFAAMLSFPRADRQA